MTKGPASEIAVRNTAPSDAEALSALEREVFSNPWTRNMLEDALLRPETIALCAGPENSLSGLVLLRAAADEAEILRLAVHPAWRRKGLGSILLRRGLSLAIKRGAATAFLEVRESNKAAVSFYAAHLFEVRGKRPRYYSDNGEAALVMARILQPDYWQPV